MGEETLNHENVLDQVLPLMFLQNILHTWQCAVRERARVVTRTEGRLPMLGCAHRPV